MLFTTSGSSISSYQRDNLRWCFEYVSDRVPVEVPQPLRTGIVLHKAFEDMLNSNGQLTLPDALLLRLSNLSRDYMTDEKEIKSFDELTRMVEPLAFWKDEFPIERTLAVEEPFTMHLGQHIELQGTPDRVVLVGGKVYHFQHKSIDKSKNLGLFITLAMRSMHELLYGIHLADKYSDVGDYGGTIYNIIRKLMYRAKPRTKAEKKTGIGRIMNKPSAMFLQTVIGIDPGAQKQAVKDAINIAYQQFRTSNVYRESGWEAIPSTRAMDGGVYANSMDPYTRVMIGEISLDDDRYFKNREERYA